MKFDLKTVLLYLSLLIIVLIVHLKTLYTVYHLSLIICFSFCRMRKTILLQRFLQGNNQFQDSQRCLSCFLINSNQRLFPSQSNNQLTHKLLVGQFINSCYLSALYYSENAKDAEETTSSSSQLIRKESNNSQTDNRTSNKTVKGKQA